VALQYSVKIIYCQHGAPIFATTSDAGPITTFLVLVPKSSDATAHPSLRGWTVARTLPGVGHFFKSDPSTSRRSTRQGDHEGAAGAAGTGIQ
jgi:hypothetical protein